MNTQFAAYEKNNVLVGLGCGLRGKDPLYQPMAGHFDTSAAYQAALDLVLKGLEQPSGYTEPLLHAWRLKVKAGTA